MSDKVTKAYHEMRDDCVRMLADAVISGGLNAITPKMNVVFHHYDEWRKLADKK